MDNAKLLLFLHDGARYFEKRSAEAQEDRVILGYQQNAENCRKAAAAFSAANALNLRLTVVLAKLVGHFNAFTEDGWGSQDDAYYCLAKGAQDTWAEARALLADMGKGDGG